MKDYCLLFVSAILFAACKPNTGIQSQTPVASKTIDTVIVETWKRFYDSVGIQGCFVLYSPTDSIVRVYNPERAATRFTPASTFKIFNSLVALETGVVKDENEIIKWDGEVRQNKNWNKDMNLKEAYKVSCVPCYQQLARKAGQTRMQYWLDTVGYGNKVTTPHIDDFWLEEGLEISANEQVAFLEKLYNNALPFSTKTMNTVKQVMLVQDVPYIMRAKTGWGLRVKNSTGWYVGWVEKDGKPYFFANNIAFDKENLVSSRIEISLAILRSEGVLQ
ncbi:MAG: class D beta-lactamase [Bacteroidota bacterium]